MIGLKLVMIGFRWQHKADHTVQQASPAALLDEFSAG
jgi:hypothetical protein